MYHATWRCYEVAGCHKVDMELVARHAIYRWRVFGCQGRKALFNFPRGFSNTICRNASLSIFGVHLGDSSSRIRVWRGWLAGGPEALPTRKKINAIKIRILGTWLGGRRLSQTPGGLLGPELQSSACHKAALL
jgi:hypothetical protein